MFFQIFGTCKSSMNFPKADTVNRISIALWLTCDGSKLAASNKQFTSGKRVWGVFFSSQMLRVFGVRLCNKKATGSNQFCVRIRNIEISLSISKLRRNRENWSVCSNIFNDIMAQKFNGTKKCNVCLVEPYFQLNSVHQIIQLSKSSE